MAEPKPDAHQQQLAQQTGLGTSYLIGAGLLGVVAGVFLGWAWFAHPKTSQAPQAPEPPSASGMSS